METLRWSGEGVTVGRGPAVHGTERNLQEKVVVVGGLEMSHDRHFCGIERDMCRF